MKCPVCSNRLRQITAKSVILDVCPNCKGIWFDCDEFADFVGKLSASEQITAEKVKLFQRRNVQALHKLKEKARLCPKCSSKLRKFNYSYDSNVFLDKCPNCGGIWADGGEIEQVARYLKEDPQATAVGEALAESIAQRDCEEALEGQRWFIPLRIIVPLSDDAPRDRFPVVTVALIALCTLILVCDMYFNPDRLVHTVDYIPKDPAHFFDADLVASIFSHGGIFHLVWNMLFLWLFGDNVEDQFGRWGYGCLFLGFAFTAVLLGLVFATSLSIWAVGISTAVSAIMGAYFIFYPVAKVKVFVFSGVMEIPAVVFLGMWFLFQFISPFLSKAEEVGLAANIPSVAGFLFGALTAFLKKIAKQPRTA